jgi:hypothetical protein
MEVTMTENITIEGSQVENPELPNLTPYAAAKVVTKVLQAANLMAEDESFKPQAMYGKRKVIGTTEDGQLIGESFKKWLDSYVEARRNGLAEGERHNYDELAAKFM